MMGQRERYRISSMKYGKSTEEGQDEINEKLPRGKILKLMNES